MTNREKYNKAFVDCFSVTEDVLKKSPSKVFIWNVYS